MAEPRTNESIPGLIRDAIAEAADWLKAEVALFRAQAKYAAEKYMFAAAACVSALVFALLAVSYLLYAVMLALVPYLGPIGAPLAIAAVLLVIAAGLGLYGRSLIMQARILPPRVSRALAENSDRKP